MNGKPIEVKPNQPKSWLPTVPVTVETITKDEAENRLRQLLGCDIIEQEINPAKDFAISIQDLKEWCSNMDESVILMDTLDLDNSTITIYLGDTEDLDEDHDHYERDISAFIVVDQNGNTFSYGYSGD